MRLLPETQKEEPAKKYVPQENRQPKEKDRSNLDYFDSRVKPENKRSDRQDQHPPQKPVRKDHDFSHKPSYTPQQNYHSHQATTQQPRVQNIPPELKPDRVFSALIRSTPHVKLNGSVYDNPIILVLPSSLFGK